MSDHRDAARRQHGLQQAWPTMLRAAERRTGLILCEDEASCAQWDSLRDTWARRGQQPEGKTRGKRTGSNVLGAMEYCSGRLWYQGIEGRLTSARDQTFAQTILTHTQAHSPTPDPIQGRSTGPTSPPRRGLPCESVKT